MKPRSWPALSLFSVLTLLGAAETAVSADDVVEYVVLDGVGNVRVVTDEKGNILERHDYLAFGEECTTGNCANNPAAGGGEPLKFTGKERDQETGLDYFGARYYGSAIGRFTTIDPANTIQDNLVDPQRWNRYAYGRNNPLRYVDPDGKDIVTYFGGVLTAFGSNLTGGLAPRPTYSDSDFMYGQFVGDSLSLVASVYESSVGAGLFGGGASLTATGVLAEVGVPAAVGGGVLIGHSAVLGSSALLSLSKNAGIYEFPDKGASGTPYVGQSGNIPKRLSDHERKGRLTPGTEATTDVAGGKTAREVAEHKRIQEITGGVPARKSDKVSNKVDPIGPKRQDLLKE